jgi:hypothetical protein
MNGIILAKLTLHQGGRFKNQIHFLKSSVVALAWFSGSPSAAPSNAGLTGVFGHRLSEFRGGLRFVQATRASFDGRPANRVAQGRSGSWGVLFFAFFLMDKHKKEWSPRGEIDLSTNQDCYNQRKVTRRKGENNE